VMADGALAALITGLFGILAIIVRRGDKAQERDHGVVQQKLDNLKSVASLSTDVHHIDLDLSVIEVKVDRQDEKLSALKDDFAQHISDHMNSSMSGEKDMIPVRRKKKL